MDALTLTYYARRRMPVMNNNCLKYSSNLVHKYKQKKKEKQSIKILLYEGKLRLGSDKNIRHKNKMDKTIGRQLTHRRHCREILTRLANAPLPMHTNRMDEQANRRQERTKMMCAVSGPLSISLFRFAMFVWLVWSSLVAAAKNRNTSTAYT